MPCAVRAPHTQSSASCHSGLFAAAMDAESDRRMAELRIKTLDDLVARQSGQISELQQLMCSFLVRMDPSLSSPRRWMEPRA
jgi:hypothetical protein